MRQHLLDNMGDVVHMEHLARRQGAELAAEESHGEPKMLLQRQQPASSEGEEGGVPRAPK